MGINKRLKMLVLATVTAVALMGCGSKANDTVWITMGSTKITQSMVDELLAPQLEQLKAQFGEDYESQIDETTKENLKHSRQHAADGLIEKEIFKVKAKEMNLIPSDADLETEAKALVESVKQGYGGDAGFEQALTANGHTLESFTEMAKDQVIMDKVMESILKDVTVTDEDVVKYYEENKETEFVKPAGADTRHILFKEDQEAAANEAKAKIDAGTSFDDLFKEYEGNKVKNEYPIAEDLSFVMYEQQNFDPLFLEGLKPLKEGEISTPVKSSFGYHIIEAKNIADGKAVEPLENIKDKLKSMLEQNKQYEVYQAKLDEWKKELKVEYNKDVLAHDETIKH